MTIPETVKIGGLIFDVKFTEHLTRDSSCLGQHCGNLQEIQIDSGLKQQMKESSFLHEVLHGIDFVYGVGLSHEAVKQLEGGLYAFIKDNPAIFGG
jgi:hypothetical protein